MADTKDRTKQKACLERYRKACIEILGVLNKAAPQVRILALSFNRLIKGGVRLLQSRLAGPGTIWPSRLLSQSGASYQATAECRC